MSVSGCGAYGSGWRAGGREREEEEVGDVEVSLGLCFRRLPELEVAADAGEPIRGPARGAKTLLVTRSELASRLAMEK